MYHIARMEVAETPSDVGQLVTRVSLRRTRQEGLVPVQVGLRQAVF